MRTDSDGKIETRPQIFLFGTWHFYQENKQGKNTCTGAPQFLRRMRQLVYEYRIDFLFEEMSEEETYTFPNRGDSTRSRTWLERLAEEVKIPINLIDPDTQERELIGIPANEGCTPASMENRERFWLDRIREREFGRALCVVGGAHVESFKSKLTQAGYDVEIVERDYNPENLKKV